MPIPYRALLAGVVLLAAPHISNADTAHATNVTPAVAAQPATIEGFRSAHFGMSEADIRKAIKHDFALSGSSVQSGVNPLQRTQMINIAVPDLVPGSGKATINYIFGYTSQRLIEINVTWATAADPVMTPSVLLRTGSTLQGYFQGEAFPSGQTASNAVLANGSVLLFRGTDAGGHTAALVLGGSLQMDAKTHKGQLTPTSLTLVYAADPAHPDIFQLQKGSF